MKKLDKNRKLTVSSETIKRLSAKDISEEHLRQAAGGASVGCTGVTCTFRYAGCCFTQ